MEYKRDNVDTCSKSTRVVIEDGIIKSVEMVGGCQGNIKGITRLVEGMAPETAIRCLQGIACGPRATSCPDQLAITLQEAIEKI